jgi:hypothetical protein
VTQHLSDVCVGWDSATVIIVPLADMEENLVSRLFRLSGTERFDVTSIKQRQLDLAKDLQQNC